MGNLVFGSAERPGNPIVAAEIPVVRDNDGAIGQGTRPTERPEKNTHAARHSPNLLDARAPHASAPVLSIKLWHKVYLH